MHEQSFPPLVAYAANYVFQYTVLHRDDIQVGIVGDSVVVGHRRGIRLLREFPCRLHRAAEHLYYFVTMSVQRLCQIRGKVSCTYKNNFHLFA